jgi:hypothetical protein
MKGCQSSGHRRTRGSLDWHLASSKRGRGDLGVCNSYLANRECSAGVSLDMASETFIYERVRGDAGPEGDVADLNHGSVLICRS